MDDKHHMTDYATDTAVMNTYGRAEIAFVRGEGCWLESESQERYLDCASGIAVNTLGHAHPRLVAALHNQASKLWHTSNLYRIPGQEQVAKTLASLSGLDQVFFCNSGAEATEASIKVARRYFYSIGKPQKNKIICIKNSFHGRTIAAIYASGSKKMTEGFGPKVPGFDHIKFKDSKPRFPNLRKKINKNTAAIMVETILGEGGIKPIPDKCLKYLRKICNEKRYY